MRAGGINWLAVLAAAAAFYAVGFVIYGLIIPEEWWMAAEGISAEEMEAVGDSRMWFGVLMPLATATFMAVLFKWAGGVTGASRGAQWGMVVALASAVPTAWYGWVYGVGPADVQLCDTAHLLLGHIVAGAVLGAWR